MKSILLTAILWVILTPAFSAIRYNDVQQKSSHNSFSRNEGGVDAYWVVTRIIISDQPFGGKATQT